MTARAKPDRRGFWLALFGAGSVAAAPAPVLVPVCFTAADNARLTFPVFQQAPPPRGTDDYRYYPLTAAVSMQMASLHDAPAGIATYFFHWGNRSTAPLAGPGGRTILRKANFQPSSRALRRQRSGFSSVARADACTIAQLAVLLGDAAPRSIAARGSGITLVPETAQADTGLTGPVDGCVLSAGPLPRNLTGVLLDFEVADGRTPEQALAMLQRYAAMVHASGRRALLLIDPFDAPTQRFTGISAVNAGRIVKAFDETTLMLWAGNVQHDIPASYKAQRAIIDAHGKVDPQRLIIDFDLAGTSQQDAAFVRDAITRDHLGGVIFWRNRAVQGGACSSDVNRKIAIVAFGSGT